MIEFEKYGDTQRLNRTTWVTEKINGTNAGIIIRPWDGTPSPDDGSQTSYVVYTTDHGPVEIAFQSRNRIITPQSDNAGFARWGLTNIYTLADSLGLGRHFGEWWGPGIQGNPYKTAGKKFSLFNAQHWNENFADVEEELSPIGVDVVPVLGVGTDFVQTVAKAEALLREHGTFLTEWHRAGVPWIPAEGYVVFHSATRTRFKVLLENDEISKTEAGLK